MSHTVVHDGIRSPKNIIVNVSQMKKKAAFFHELRNIDIRNDLAIKFFFYNSATSR